MRADFQRFSAVSALVAALALTGGLASLAAQGAGQGQTGQTGQGQTQGGGGRRGGQAGGGQGAAGNGPQRDNTQQQPTEQTGTAVVSGSVVAVGTGAPVRSARVLLSGNGLRGGKGTTTDAQGHYTFTALPAGRYTVSASKPAYVTAVFGQKEPGRPGTPIDVADGQQLTNVDIRIYHGGVLTGVLRDENGDASPGTIVRAFRYQMNTGERELVGAGSDTTDDRGVYRIYGLQPGDYIVTAEPRINVAELRQMAQDVVQAVGGGGAGGGLGALGGLGGALNGRGGGRGGRGGAGGAGGANGGIQQILQDVLSPPTPSDQPVGYAPVYYPGTTTASTATAVTVGPAEEKGGLDFQLQLVPTATISGMVAGAEDQSVQGVNVTLVDENDATPGLGTQSARLNRDGSFTFTNVAPGQYTLSARAMRRVSTPSTTDPSSTGTQTTTTPAAGGRGTRGGGGAGGRGGFGGGRGGNFAAMDVLWAEMPVSVSGTNQDGLVLSLQPGLTVSGSIALQGAPPASQTTPLDLTRVRVQLSPLDRNTGGGPFGGGGAGTGQADANGQFTIDNLTPGKYTVRVTGASGWNAASALVGGYDALDFGVELKAGQSVAGMSVVLTSGTTQLAGTLQDASGQPTSDFTIIVYPVEKQYWLPQSRRIQSTRPDTSGKFVVSGLPPGDYMIAAVTDVETGEWYDPSFLAQLGPASTPVTLVQGQTKTQDLRIAGQ